MRRGSRPLRFRGLRLRPALAAAVAGLTVAAGLVAGCARLGAGPRPVVLATTTTVEDSGILDVLVAAFTARTGIPVRAIVAGTGQALEYGRRGDADLVLVHAPELEQAFLAAGFGVDRRPVMQSAFIVVGPPDDPARVRGLGDAAEALRRIAAAGAGGRARWVSRGDRSGTHQMELALWERAAVSPAARDPAWYVEAGAGMGETLTLASEKRAYTLADDATFTVWARRVTLEVLVSGDPRLANPYHVIRVNPARFPRVNALGARMFADFLTSEAGRALIAEFGRAQYGRPLFRVLPEADGG